MVSLTAATVFHQVLSRGPSPQKARGVLEQIR